MPGLVPGIHTAASGEAVERDTRNKSTADRFRFCGRDAWAGFKPNSKVPAESGLGSTPGAPSPFTIMPAPHIVMPGLVPGISLGAIAEAEVDARNKSIAVRFRHC